MTTSVKVGVSAERVLLRFDDGVGHVLHHKAAKDLSTYLLGSFEDEMVEIRFGAVCYSVPRAQCKRIAAAVYRKALEAEEWATRERLADDGALLCRVGFPVGLTNHPVIKEEIRQRAAWDSDLRRYLPGGVRSQAVVGTPSISLATPTLGGKPNGT